MTHPVQKESNLLQHAKRELTIAGYHLDDSGDGPDRWMVDHLLKMVQAFADEEHSGISASYAINALKRLLRFEPLTPLTGQDDEWIEVAEGVFQNRRCSRVFKENGESYNIDGRVFREPNGACFTNRNSRVPVTFPYLPKGPEYVDVPAPTDEEENQ